MAAYLSKVHVISSNPPAQNNTIIHGNARNYLALVGDYQQIIKNI